jgi:O-antigen ligase
VVLRTLILVGMIGGGALATQTDTFQRLISSVQGKEYNWTEEDGRIQIWQRGLGYIAGHPVTGVGITCFEIAEGLISGRSTTSRGVRWAAAHNSYVQVCAETGIPAFLFWLLTILSSVRELNRQKTLLEPWNDLPDVRCMLAFGAVARTSLVTYLVGAVFLSMGYLVYLYLIVGMTIALARLTDERVAQLEESDDEEDEDETDQLDTADAALSSA